MDMKPSLHLTIRPALIMTPRLQQALKLLQVPTLELQQILKQEIMQNPLLEEVDEVTESEDLAKEDSPEESANQESEDPAEEDPIDWSEYMQEGSFDRAYIPQQETSGVARCHTIFNCTMACPREIQITKAIGELKMATITGKVE